MSPGIGERFRNIKSLFGQKKKKGPVDYCVGIDLGTTKTSVGYVSFSEQKDVELLTFTNDGEKQLPSIVALDRPTSEMMNTTVLKTYIGEELLRENGENWGYIREKESLAQWGIFPRAKLSVGKGKFDPKEFPQALLDRFPEITPEDIIACLLAEVRNVFKAKTKHDLFKATITVPASWDPEQRRATKMSAHMAGFEDVVLLEEPVAALLKVVDLNMYKEPTSIMIVDFGGGTCDVAIVTVSNNEIKLRGAGAQNSLGGELVDEILLEDFISRIKADKKLAESYSHDENKKAFREAMSKIENDPTLRSSIRRQLEGVKREINRKIVRQENIKSQIDEPEDILEDALSSMQRAYQTAPQSYNVEISNLGIIGTYSYKITSNEVDALLRQPRPQLSKDDKLPSENRSVIGAFDAILQDVQDLYCPHENIETVFLVGGSSYLYFVRQRIREKLFPDLKPEVADEKIQARANREEAVVRGATLYERQRRHGEVHFKSRLFYDLRLEGDESSLISNDAELSIAGIETDPERYKLRIAQELPPEKPLRFKMIRAGGVTGQQEIYKDLSHGIPIQPDQEIVLKFQITSDSIIFVKGKDFITDKEFKPIEVYPITEDEGLTTQVNLFKSRFPRFFH